MNIIIFLLFLLGSSAATIALYNFRNAVRQLQEANYRRKRGFRPAEYSIPLLGSIMGQSEDEAVEEAKRAYFHSLKEEYSLAAHLFIIGTFYAVASVLSAMAILYLMGIIK